MLECQTLFVLYITSPVPLLFCLRRAIICLFLCPLLASLSVGCSEIHSVETIDLIS